MHRFTCRPMHPTHPSIHTYIHTHAYSTYTHTHTHTQTHTHTHTHTQTHIHTHTHTQRESTDPLQCLSISHPFSLSFPSISLTFYLSLYLVIFRKWLSL